MITFKYNNKQYTTNNLLSKLKKLGISENEIEILGNRDLGEIDTSIKKYTFKNRLTGEVIISTYNNLDHLKEITDIAEYDISK